MQTFTHKNIQLIGAAIDACAGVPGAALTPQKLGFGDKPALAFEHVLEYIGARNDIDELAKYFTQLAKYVRAVLASSKFPIVVGGDHSIAIGTWSGVATALAEKGLTLGLIWIDAHMDAHTP